MPNLWFGDVDKNETPRQRFHVEVYGQQALGR